jgi:hypothetical protein
MPKNQSYLWGNDMVKENAKKLTPAIKKVLLIKGSHYLCIPKKFVNHFGIKVGDSVVLAPGVETISILPMRGD